MKLNTYINKASNLYAENRLLKFAVVCIGIAVIVSAIFSYTAIRYQKVVILPPVVDRRVVITGNNADEHYVKLFTRYAMTLLNNYTAAHTERKGLAITGHNFLLSAGNHPHMLTSWIRV